MYDNDGGNFGDWVGTALPSWLRFGHLLTGQPSLAEDLVQAALTRMWSVARRAGGDLSKFDEPTAYAKRSMVNIQRSAWRRRSLRLELTSPAVAADSISAVVERDEVWRALDQLPRQQRVVLILRYYEDLPEKEIAVLMNISVGTVKSHASRALTKLATLVPAEAEERSR